MIFVAETYPDYVVKCAMTPFSIPLTLKPLFSFISTFVTRRNISDFIFWVFMIQNKGHGY